MDAVRALLRLSPDHAKLEKSTPDAVVLDCRAAADEKAEKQARREVDALLTAEQRTYICAPPVATRRTRDVLRATLRPDVYGVCVPELLSVDQLRYADGVIEELERAAEIRPGLTALALWVDSTRALALLDDLLGALADGSERATLVGLDAAAIGAELGVPADSPTLEQARAATVIATAARGLPAVVGSFSSDAVTDAEAVAAARNAGFRGVVTPDPKAVAGLLEAFPEPAQDEPPPK